MTDRRRKPTKKEIAQLFQVHRSAQARSERLMRSYMLDDTRSWIDPNGYRLSDRVWNARAEVRRQIDDLLRRAILNGEDALLTARKLEEFLNPDFAPVRNARGRLIRNQAKSIVTRSPGRGGMGSFSARRLARTEVTRAHGAATVWATDRNPFATGIKWSLSPAHPRFDVCDGIATANRFDLGPGVYPTRDLPTYPAHSQCLCHLSTVTVDDVDAVIDRLRRQYGLD